MPVRALVLFAVLAVSIAPALADEYGYYADDDFVDSGYHVAEYGTDEHGDDAYKRHDNEFDRPQNRDTDRFGDYLRVGYAEQRDSRLARRAHFTPDELSMPGELAMPGELTEPDYSEFEELPLDAYENFGSCDNCVGDDLCDDCQSECGSCPTGCGGFSAGVEMTILKFHTGNDSRGGLFGFGNDYRHEPSPRVWIGYEGGNGWGFRGRYWQYDTELTDSLLFEEGGTLALLNLTSQLDVYTIDFEVTKRFCLGQTTLRSSIGGRNGAIRRGTSYSAGTFDDDGDGEDATFILVNALQAFEGTGLTFALEGNRPLFCSQLEAVFNVRGSVLWGENDFSTIIQVAEAEPDGNGNLDVDLDAQDLNGDENDTMWIGELQAGLQWTQPYRCFGGGVMFVRSVFEAQWWAYPNVELDSEGTVPSQDLAFYGVAFSAGFSH